MSEIIASVSGVRGIIGDSLTPENIIKYTSAFAKLCRGKSKNNKIIIGRDGRLFGDLITGFVSDTLTLSGFEVTNIGVAPTPTIQIATEDIKSSGGISVTASHNPQQWNGLKFLNSDGTFLSENEMNEIIRIVDEGKFYYSGIDNLISIKDDSSWIDKHIEKVLKLNILNINKIKKRKFKVVVDAVNSSGSVIVPKLLEKLGCKVIKLFCDGSGKFPHTPEPIPENLILLAKAVKKNKADLGISVDPDADRLVLITDKGEPFSEENTITTAANFLLKNIKKNKNVTVNLSTTRAVDDIAKKNNAKVFRSPVGEINVVNEMKKNKSLIGGEGSGGVIYSKLHYGRDSLVGIVLVLNELADFKGKISKYKKTIPEYFISKTKIDNVNNPDKILKAIEEKYLKDKDVIKIWINDGLKIDFKNYWVHMRKSNTEPIVRIITEAKSKKEAENLQNKFLGEIINRKSTHYDNYR
ncbi:MAG: phosphoglucosamine mutase [Bacteroidota bacterium]|nr:phosphoglucosamine mutase [Bacteroidota bacterium]